MLFSCQVKAVFVCNSVAVLHNVKGRLYNL